MNAVAVWRTLRAVRWALWLATVAYYLYVAGFRADHLTAFGHLLLRTEMFMFGLPIGDVFAGLLELWAREAAGAPRPFLFSAAKPKTQEPSGISR
jgi:hypothetical protein